MDRCSLSVKSMSSLDLMYALVAARAWRFDTTELAMMQMFSQSGLAFDQLMSPSAARRFAQSLDFISSSPRPPSARRTVECEQIFSARRSMAVLCCVSTAFQSGMGLDDYKRLGCKRRLARGRTIFDSMSDCLACSEESALTLLTMRASYYLQNSLNRAGDSSV